VERALADALDRASSVGRWDVVARLATELEARRIAHENTNVVHIDARRSRSED